MNFISPYLQENLLEFQLIRTSKSIENLEPPFEYVCLMVENLTNIVTSKIILEISNIIQPLFHFCFCFLFSFVLF